MANIYIFKKKKPLLKQEILSAIQNCITLKIIQSTLWNSPSTSAVLTFRAVSAKIGLKKLKMQNFVLHTSFTVYS